VQKRHCTLRAEWRLLRGQPAQPLSGHYRLDCDYGTAVVTTYRDGEAVFLCASHASAIERPKDDCIAGVRLVEAEPAGSTPPLEEGEQKPAETAAIETPAIRESAPVPARTIVWTPSVATPSAPTASVTTPNVATASVATPKVRREPVPSKKRSAPDLAYGDASKALVDEAIWNLPAGDLDVYNAELQQGKPPIEAAQSAGGQIAIIHRKIAEYTLKIEAILSESKATIDVCGLIDAPFEEAMLEIISNAKLSEAEKDGAIEALGALQAQVKSGLNREITPLQAHRVARAIGDRGSWGRGLAEELKPMFRAVYRSVRKAVDAAAPQAKDLSERLTNLYAAKSDLESQVDSAVRVTATS